VGVDGLEWNVLLPLLKNGRLPNLTKMMKEGYYGQLATFMPTVSPVIWTSVATGKIPAKHGIEGFVHSEPAGKLILYNNPDRKTKALWDIASDYRKIVIVIGWWMTFPVDQINGIMVAQTNAPPQDKGKGGEGVWKGSLVKGMKDQVYPPHRQDEIMGMLNEVEQELPNLTRQTFGRFLYPLSGLSQRLWDNCQWIFRADEIYRRIASRLIQKESPDLTCLYIGGTDVVSHRFWRYMQPQLYQHKPTRKEIANFGKIIENYYIYVDQTVGQLQKACGQETTLIIVSDHGMKPINLKTKFGRDASLSQVNSAHHYGAQPGVFLAAGPRIRKLRFKKSLQNLTRADLDVVASVLDITPTILVMMQVPIGKDMDGIVIKSTFDDDFPFEDQPKPVLTHDTPAFLANRGKNVPVDPSQEERLEQLRSLGYIGEKKEEAKTKGKEEN
jgi:predicted AlkP superfamily pyrophosphatase or phosphodiesterase